MAMWHCESFTSKEKYILQWFISAVLIILKFWRLKTLCALGCFHWNVKAMYSYPKEIRFRGLYPLFEKQRYLVHNIGIAYYTEISSHMFLIARKHVKTQFVVSVVGSTLNWWNGYIPYYWWYILMIYSLLFRCISLSVLIYDKYTVSSVSP